MEKFNIIVNNFLNYLKYERNYSQNTIDSYENDLYDFEKYILKDVKTIFEITKDDIRTFTVKLSKSNLAIRSIRRKLSALKSLLRYLVKQKKLDDRLLEYFIIPKADERLPGFLYQSEMMELLTNIEAECKSPLELRDFAILMVLYSTGVRVSELVNMTFERLDLEQGIIKVEGKGKKERFVFLGKEAKAALQKYLNIRNELITKNKLQKEDDKSAIFLTRTGYKITRTAVLVVVKKYASRCGLKTNISPHSFRHSFATHMLENEADLRVVQELLGHESLSSTQIYTHITKDKLRDTFRKAHPHAKKKDA